LKENIRRVGEGSKLIVDAVFVAIAGFISPFTTDLNEARQLFEEIEFYKCI